MPPLLTKLLLRLLGEGRLHPTSCGAGKKSDTTEKVRHPRTPNGRTRPVVVRSTSKTARDTHAQKILAQSSFVCPTHDDHFFLFVLCLFLCLLQQYRTLHIHAALMETAKPPDRPLVTVQQARTKHEVPQTHTSVLGACTYVNAGIFDTMLTEAVAVAATVVPSARGLGARAKGP